MSEEDQESLFVFFGQISKSKGINRGGMGLGLTISKMILEQLGGSICVESQPQKGSRFTFRIPLEIEEAERGENDSGSMQNVDNIYQIS